jgi:23S rRNA (adenine-N6)-dimethyltransferase
VSSSRRQPSVVANFSGQHFLSSNRLARQLVAIVEEDISAGCAVEDSQGRAEVLDIGAGKGALTIPLAEHGWRVIAVESDQALAKRLQGQLAAMCNVQVICQDFLRMPLPTAPFAVVASIPFSITTAILGRLMDRPSSAFLGGVILVEYGAALRVLGWRTWFDMETVAVVPARSFTPPPRVDAAVLRIRRRNPSPVPPRAYRRFMAMVSRCLDDPSLAIAKALRNTFTAEQIRRLTRDLGADRSLPVCCLAPKDWAAVYKAMCLYVPPHRWP